MRRRLTSFLACVLLATSGVPACKKEAPPIAAELPVVRDDTKGLTFTFIDDKGNPHVVDTLGEIPGAQSTVVRVMDPSRVPPEDMMYVADLTKKNLDGSFVVRLAPRQELEDVMLARRKALGPTLAGVANDRPLGDGGAAASDSAQPRVIIYGASWCGACHEAAAWLKAKNVRFVEKDIEKEPGAEREMHAKLAKAGLAGGGIPVIDVGGKIMVGFSAPKLQAALGEAI